MLGIQLLYVNFLFQYPQKVSKSHMYSFVNFHKVNSLVWYIVTPQRTPCPFPPATPSSSSPGNFYHCRLIVWWLVWGIFGWGVAALRGFQNISLLTRDWTWVIAVKAPSPSHWTAREFPMMASVKSPQCSLSDHGRATQWDRAVYRALCLPPRQLSCHLCHCPSL